MTYFACDLGIKSITSSKFVTENNAFENVNNTPKNTTGIYILEAGPDANQVYNNTFTKNAVLEIYDNKGAKILQQNFLNTVNVDCSTWAKNIYYLRIISTKGSLIGTEKILVQ